MYPFALMGVFLGALYLDYGAVVVPLLVVPILVARQTFASYLALKESQEAAVRTLIGALEAKDPYTAGHAERVAGYAEYIGEELGMSPSRLERLRFAALMHDVGKLVVPNHLLNKKGKLTAEEFGQVRLHEEVSVEILTRIDFLAPGRAERDERGGRVRAGRGRSRPADRAAHRRRRGRVRRDDLHPLVPQGAPAGDRVQRAAQELGQAVPPACRRRAHRFDRAPR